MTQRSCSTCSRILDINERHADQIQCTKCYNRWLQEMARYDMFVQATVSCIAHPQILGRKLSFVIEHSQARIQPALPDPDQLYSS